MYTKPVLLEMYKAIFKISINCCVAMITSLTEYARNKDIREVRDAIE